MGYYLLIYVNKDCKKKIFFFTWRGFFKELKHLSNIRKKNILKVVENEIKREIIKKIITEIIYKGSTVKEIFKK